MLIAYERHYHELVKKYKDEIIFINDMLAEIRKERETFYQETLQDIENKLHGDECISEEAKREWIAELKVNMERSFAQSENIIQHYITNNTEEFDKAMRKILLGEKI